MRVGTHKAASLCVAFPPAKALGLLRRLEFHYTPKHGGWLNMAEIEISILGRQCMNRRIGEQGTLTTEVAAWQRRRNEAGVPIKWRFTVNDTRRRPPHVYPETS
jgi:hypothetical protein